MLPIFKTYRSGKVISVYITKEGCKRISREDFENWLERTDRLSYITEVTPDHTGEPQGGEVGEFTLDEYWDLPQDYINKDLSDYIVFNNPEYWDLKKAIDKVLK